MAIHLKSTPNENKNKPDMRLRKMETKFKGQKEEKKINDITMF